MRGVEVGGAAVAPVVDALAVDQRHGLPGRSVGGHAALVERNDARVAQARQHLLFAQEAVVAPGNQGSERQHLHGRKLAGGRFLGHGAIHRGHAATTDLLAKPPATQPSPGQRGLRRGLDGLEVRRAFKRPAVAGMRRQQALDPGTQAGIRGQCLQRHRTVFGGQIEQLVEDAVGFAPGRLVVRIHVPFHLFAPASAVHPNSTARACHADHGRPDRAAPYSSCACRNARARCHCR